jgi:hypothetical protein
MRVGSIAHFFITTERTVSGGPEYVGVFLPQPVIKKSKGTVQANFVTHFAVWRLCHLR